MSLSLSFSFSLFVARSDAFVGSACRRGRGVAAPPALELPRVQPSRVCAQNAQIRRTSIFYPRKRLRRARVVVLVILVVVGVVVVVVVVVCVVAVDGDVDVDVVVVVVVNVEIRCLCWLRLSMQEGCGRGACLGVPNPRRAQNAQINGKAMFFQRKTLCV